MRAIAAIAALGIRQNVRNPLMSGLLVLAPIMLIFIIGESLRKVMPVDNPFAYLTGIVLLQSIAHCALVGYWAVHRQTHHHTLPRISVAPVSATAFIVGSFTAGFLSATGFMGAVTIGSALFLGVGLGGSIGKLFAVIVCGTFFSASFGVLVGALARDGRPTVGLLSFGIPVLILFGGGYVPIPESGPLAVVSPFTPMRWVNDGLRATMGPGDAASAWTMVLLCIPTGIALVALAVLQIRSRRSWS